MQQLQPQVAQVRRRYARDPARMQRELLALQREAGVRPLAGCLPLLVQIPVFLAMAQVLRHLAHVAGAVTGSGLSRYGFTRGETMSAADAQLFGAPLAGSLHDGSHRVVGLLGGSMSASITVTAVLIAVSALATLGTQLLARRHAGVPAAGPAALVQRVMLVGAPLSVVVSGLFLPLGLVVYWWTSNTWTLVQQLLVTRGG